jgi:hypothetical protein
LRLDARGRGTGQPNAPLPTHRWRRWVVALIVLAVLFPLGRFVTTATVDDGLDRFLGKTPEADVAIRALELTETLGRRTILPRRRNYLLPRARVLDVKRAPGNCTAYPPGSVPDDEYIAVVRLYTLFRIPARTFTVACGGNLI